MSRHRNAPTSLGSTLQKWLKKSGLAAEFRPYVIAQRWHELVGERLATRTHPAGLRDGVLTVIVANSAWLNELNFLREDLRARINEVLGGATVREIRLFTGRLPRTATSRPSGPRARRPSGRRADSPVKPGEDPLTYAIRCAREAQSRAEASNEESNKDDVSTLTKKNNE